jgi:Domain of unknown function (DUF2405)
MSSVGNIQFQIFHVNLDFCANGGEPQSHKLNLRNFSAAAGLSSGDSNVLHVNLLGRNTDLDGLNQDIYMANCSLEQITLERSVKSVPQNSTILATVGQIHLHSLITLWPPLRTFNSSFMSGDPNAALLALRLKVTRIDITQNIDSLRDVFVRSASPATNIPIGTPNNINISPFISSSVPRVSVEIELGQVRANFPCPEVGNKIAVELHTNGLVLSGSSHFHADPSRLRAQDIDSLPCDTLPVRMRTNVGLSIEPIQVGLRINSYPHDEMPFSQSGGIAVPLESTLESLLTLDALELTGSSVTLASVSDTDFVLLDISSTFVDLHFVTDALSVELWHPEVVSTVSLLMNTLPHKRDTPKSMNTPWSKQLSIGFCSTLSIARFTVFITSPDFNPREDMNISRGLGFHSGFSVQYCAILPRHLASIGDMLVGAQTRQKLYLPENRIMDAMSRARHTQESHCTDDLIRISLWDTGLRSAVATVFVADDPYSMEDLSFMDQNREFLSIPRTRIDIIYPGIYATEESVPRCEGLAEIPSIHLKLELVHAYSLLLAAKALKSLTTRSKSPTQPYISTSGGSKLSFRLTVQAFELLFKFPTKQSICTRINDFHMRISLGQRSSLQWDTWFFWVPRPGRKDEDCLEHLKWEELGCLRGWNVYLDRSAGSISIMMKGDTGRLRIPHQFVLSDLILSIVLTVKSVSHLIKLMPSAKFAKMDFPSAEGPKTAPTISLEVHRLIAEAADDPFESKLALISHAGYRASEIMRTHRSVSTKSDKL